MLGKLLKHEWIATARKYGLFYLVLAAMTVFAAVLHAVPVELTIFRIVETIFLGLYVITLIAVMVCSFGMAVIRFYQNMVSDEGYLTFTLPVKVEALMATKVLVGLFWQVITVFLLLGSVFCVYVLGHVEVSTFFGKLADSFNGSGITLVMVAVLLLVSVMYQLMLCYFSVSVGQSFQGNKIVGAVVTYVAVDFGIKTIMMVVFFAVVAVVGIPGLEKAVGLGQGMTVVMTCITGWILLLVIAGYLGSCYFLKKKLNLN